MSSYKYIDYSWQIEECRDCCPRQTRWGSYNCHSADDMDRVIRWIYLLKDMKVQTTPDVVAVYLIATGQERLISNLYKARPNRGEVHHCNYISSGVDCCCEVEDLCSIGLRDAELRIPRELSTMALRYMKCRVIDFIKTISGCVWETVYEAIEAGTAVKSFIYNAVTSVNYDVYKEASIANVIGIAKSLNATVMPTCSLRDTYKQPIPSVFHKDKLGFPNIENSLVNVDKNYKNYLQLLTRYLDMMTIHFQEDIATDRKSDDLKDGFCALTEALMFISGCTLGIPPAFMSSAPCITRMNKLKFLSRNDDNECCPHSARYDLNTKVISMFRNISPTAAITVGDALIDISRKSYEPYYLARILDELPERVGNESVIAFIAREIREQWHVMDQVRSLSEKQIGDYFGRKERR